MTNNDLMRLLRAVHDTDPQETEQRLARETSPCCLTFHRVRDLVLNPTLWTPDEERHVATCRHCASRLASGERNIEHPAMSFLVAWLLGELTGEDAGLMRRHLGECPRCRLLLESPWLRSWVAMVRGGQRTLDQIRGTVDAAVAVFTVLPAAAIIFDNDTDTDPSPPYERRIPGPDGSLVVTLRETDDGRLVVHAETPDVAAAGRRVRVLIGGDRDWLATDVMLAPWNGHGCDGQVDLGEFRAQIGRLGPGWCVLVPLVTGPENNG